MGANSIRQRKPLLSFLLFLKGKNAELQCQDDIELATFTGNKIRQEVTPWKHMY